MPSGGYKKVVLAQNINKWTRAAAENDVENEKPCAIEIHNKITSCKSSLVTLLFL